MGKAELLKVGRRALLMQLLMEGNAQADREMKITADEVIAKFKDDGDFDTLRLKIIRKLKENVSLSLSGRAFH
ncbi:hypothetical protein ACLOJK_012291 [Asimina triloba]